MKALLIDPENRNDRIPACAAVPFTRRVGRAFHMIGLMLAGAWPETRMIRLRGRPVG